jgi:hypothetical protein
MGACEESEIPTLLGFGIRGLTANVNLISDICGVKAAQSFIA